MQGIWPQGSLSGPVDGHALPVCLSGLWANPRLIDAACRGQDSSLLVTTHGIPTGRIAS